MPRVTINLRECEIKGNVLDISSKGSFITPEIIETYSHDMDKEFLESEEEIACTADTYDSAVAILSFNNIVGKKRVEKLLNSIRNSLTNEGNLIICDLNIGTWTLPRPYNIALKLPGEKLMKMKYTLGVNPLRVKYKDVLELLGKCGFDINKKLVYKGVYYIECAKTSEVKNEGTSSIT